MLAVLYTPLIFDLHICMECVALARLALALWHVALVLALVRL
jgi:hypothetical protein